MFTLFIFVFWPLFLIFPGSQNRFPTERNIQKSSKCRALFFLCSVFRCPYFHLFHFCVGHVFACFFHLIFSLSFFLYVLFFSCLPFSFFYFSSLFSILLFTFVFFFFNFSFSFHVFFLSFSFSFSFSCTCPFVFHFTFFFPCLPFLPFFLSTLTFCLRFFISLSIFESFCPLISLFHFSILFEFPILHFPFLIFQFFFHSYASPKMSTSRLSCLSCKKTPETFHCKLQHP